MLNGPRQSIPSIAAGSLAAMCWAVVILTIFRFGPFTRFLRENRHCKASLTCPAGQSCIAAWPVTNGRRLQGASPKSGQSAVPPAFAFPDDRGKRCKRPVGYRLVKIAAFGARNPVTLASALRNPRLSSPFSFCANSSDAPRSRLFNKFARNDIPINFRPSCN